MSNGIFISSATFATLPLDIRELLMSSVFGKNDQSSTNHGVSQQLVDNEDEDENFVEFSPRQARKYLEGCNEKTKIALEVIANSASKKFKVSSIAAALNTDPQSLSGVWSGLTRRARTISENSDAYLIWWSGEAIRDDEDNYIDQEGEVTELTYQSFRKALHVK